MGTDGKHLPPHRSVGDARPAIASATAEPQESSDSVPTPPPTFVASCERLGQWFGGGLLTLSPTVLRAPGELGLWGLLCTPCGRLEHSLQELGDTARERVGDTLELSNRPYENSNPYCHLFSVIVLSGQRRGES
jgi:hypothetical protein